MTTSTLDFAAARVIGVEATDDSLIVELADGRSVSAPLGWYPRLFHATTKERGNWRLIAEGEGVHWPDLDEDISVSGILGGRPSGESTRSLQHWLDARAKD